MFIKTLASAKKIADIFLTRLSWTLLSKIFATLPTSEVCPCCNQQSLSISFGQRYQEILGLCYSNPEFRFGIVTCMECGNELLKTEWPPRLREFYETDKSKYRLSFWEWFSFPVFVMTAYMLLLLWLLLHK